MGVQRVLFVCLGNACRSQMAEGFAKAYGKDVLLVESAGLARAMAVPVETRETMAEKNIDMSTHCPKPIYTFPPTQFDLVINLSGYPIPQFPRAVEWKVRDPIGGTPDQYRSARDQIERLVMGLIVDLRRKNKSIKTAKS
jgi:arsenate reductase